MRADVDARATATATASPDVRSTPSTVRARASSPDASTRANDLDGLDGIRRALERLPRDGGADAETSSEASSSKESVGEMIVRAFEALETMPRRARRRWEGETSRRAREALGTLRRAGGDGDGGGAGVRGRGERDALVDALYAFRRAASAKTCAPGMRVNCARAAAAAASVDVPQDARRAMWRALVDCAPVVPLDSEDVIAMASPNARIGVGAREWALKIGAALATAARSNEDAKKELFAMIDDKLEGGAGSRVVGLTLFNAVLAVDGVVASDDLVLAVHKVLTAVSGAPAENGGFACASVGMRCVCAAARYLSAADVRTLRDAWLEPRLRAQGFLWTDSTEGDDARAELSLVEYLKIPRDERVGAAAMSAFLITDLDLVGYVDGDEFRRKVVHGVVDVESPLFRALPAEERAVGKTIAAAVIAAQMNLIHTLYVAPGREEEDADETHVKIANEGGRLLCGKALDLLRLETSVNAKDASLENARMKIDELSADAHASAFLGVLSHSLTTDGVDIDDDEHVRLVTWCCEKLSGELITAPNASMRSIVSSGCASALLRLAENPAKPHMARAAVRCVSTLMDLITEPDTLCAFLKCIAFKTPSLDLLGVENKSEDDERTAYVVAALHWTIARVRAANPIAYVDDALSLFRRLFILLPRTEYATWLPHLTDAYAAAALWSGDVEKDVSVDTDRVLADAAAMRCVASFETPQRDATSTKKRPEWLTNLQTRARWLEEAHRALGDDAVLCARFAFALAEISAKSIELTSTKTTEEDDSGQNNIAHDDSRWPHRHPTPLVVPRTPLGPGGVSATTASTLGFISEHLDIQRDSIDADVPGALTRHIGLVHILITTVNAVKAAGDVIKTLGGASAGRVASAGARAYRSTAACVTALIFTLRAGDPPPTGSLRDEEREFLRLVKRALDAADSLESSRSLAASPGACRRRFAGARASLARALSLTDSDLLEDISFELAKNRKRRLTKRTAPPPPPRQRRPKPPPLPDADYESDDFVDEDGVSILQAFEPSTDEETDDDDDDDAFVVRGMTSDDDDDDDDE